RGRARPRPGSAGLVDDRAALDDRLQPGPAGVALMDRVGRDQPERPVAVDQPLTLHEEVRAQVGVLIAGEAQREVVEVARAELGADPLAAQERRVADERSRAGEQPGEFERPVKRRDLQAQLGLQLEQRAGGGPTRAQPGANQLQPPDSLALADRKSTRLNSSHVKISYAVFC